MFRTNCIVASVLVLGGCWGAPPNERILNGLCQDLFVGDTRTAEILMREANTDLDGFCTCYSGKIAADESKIARHKDVIIAIAEARNNGSLGTEEAASRVQDMIEAGEIDAFSEAELDSTGDDFQRISEEMGENGGQCPA